MKRTVFEGTINGEKFDNVNSYNQRMKELLDAGESVTASSSTKIENVPENNVNNNTKQVCDCTAITDDEEISGFPYMEDDDPYYLDLLVTNDHEINFEAREEMRKEFNRCYKAIIDFISDANNPDACVENLKAYRDEIREVINNVKKDKQYTLDAIKKINERMAKVEHDMKDLLAQHETLEQELLVLEDAKPIIKDFIEFYENLETEVIQEIKSRPCECGKKCDPDCKCDCHNNVSRTDEVATNVEEATPQRTYELSDILEHIFGGDLFGNRKRTLF